MARTRTEWRTCHRTDDARDRWDVELVAYPCAGDRDVLYDVQPQAGWQTLDPSVYDHAVLVGEDGSPVTIEIEDGSGHREFDQEAKRVVAKYKFNPKKVNGAVQQGWVRVPVVFRMEG